MPMLGRLSAVRLATWLVALLVLHCCTSCSSQEAPVREVREPLAAGETTPSKNYDRFLLVRQDISRDRRTVAQTVVEARLTPEGLAYRDIWQCWAPHFLDIFDGKLYALNSSGLVAIDLASGGAAHVALDLGSHAYAAGKLVGISPEHVVRVHNLAAGTQRELETLPSDDFRGELALSPDGKHLGFFLPTTEVVNGPAQLQIIDIENGQVESVGEPITYMPGSRIISSGIEVGPPLVWADERTVLFLQTPDLADALKRHSPHDEVRVMTADIMSGKVTTVGDVPKQPEFRCHFYKLSRPSGVGGPVLLVDERAYSIDLRRGALTEGVSLGGGFRLEPAHVETETGAPFLWYEERQLGQVRVHNWPVLSPDAKKVIWIGGPSYGVHCYDADEDVVREVDRGHVQDEFLWFSEEDLEATGQLAGTEGSD